MPEDAVDDYIIEQMQAQHIPGLSLAVVQEGHVCKSQGYGLANLELGVPAAPETVYQIGSLTKQFTATAIVMLAQEGLLSLDTPITQYENDLPAAWAGVTIRHLLTHTSGIPSYTSLPDFMTFACQPTSRERLLEITAGLPLDFPPGEQYLYNNTGYYLLGSIIEKCSGQSYARFLQSASSCRCR